MRLLILCLVVACCHAQNSGDSLLLRIEEHQSKLRNWEEDNTRLLATLTEKRMVYDKTVRNEEMLLEIVDYIVKKNMEILQNVVGELNKIQLNVASEVDGEKTSNKTLDRELGIERNLANTQLTNVECDGDGDAELELATEDENEAHGEVEKVEGDVNEYETFEETVTDTQEEDKQNENENDDESSMDNDDLETKTHQVDFWYPH